MGPDDADFSEVSFDINMFSGLTDDESRTILDSMIVRNALNDSIEMLASNPLEPYPTPLTDADYTSANLYPDDYLIGETILTILNYYGY